MSNNKVDISEVDKYSNDFKEASEEIRSNLDKVKEHIDSINNMESFSGKAAKEAKGYFNELHLTILESFRGLFDDLEENLKQHIQTFATEVDSSDSAVIESNYLQDVKEDINEIYEDLEKQDEIFHDTIEDVADITSATSPDFSEVNEWKRKSVEKIKELDEDLVSFTSTDAETDVKEIMNKIETVMNNAKTSEGKARFADFKGASDNSELKKLMEYNESKNEETMEKAKDAKESAVKQLDETSSKDVVNKAYQEFKDGDISYEQYIAILDGVKNTSGDMDESKLKEESTDDFINYLKDRGMLDDYLDDHKVLAAHVETKEKVAELEERDSELKTIEEEAWKDFKKGLLDYESYKSLVSGMFHSGGEFLKNMVNSEYTKKISEEVAEKLTDWWKHNTNKFLDRGLSYALIGGGDIAVRETPTKLANALRTGAKYSPKAIGSLMDFGAQVITGEDVGDAAIKTGGHLLGAAIGGGLVTLAVMSAPFSVPAAAVTAASLAATTLGSMAFDWAYDNGLKEGIDKVGDAVSGFVGKIGSIF